MHPGLFRAVLGLLLAVTAAAADPEIVPPSGVKFERLRLRELPVFVPRVNGAKGIEVLTRKDITAELRMVTGIDLHERGQNPLPPPLPRLSCRFESYSVIDHDWMTELLDWVRLEEKHLGLNFRAETWDCDDFSIMANAMADLAQLKSSQHHPPHLIGRLIVGQANAWAGVPAGGTHELVIFRSGRAWWVAEPQNGTMASLWEYPNRRHIREILFN